MKKCIIVVAALCLFCSMAYAADDCNSEYAKLIKELENSNIVEAEKNKYLPELKKALQLCKEGKDAEAEKIVKDLKNQGLSEEMFDNLSGN
jgi:hypothetical protein